MKLLSNAKINFGLRILKKRSDGFHHIESILIPIALYDEITIEASTQFHFSTSGISISSDSKENLCVKAYQLLRKDFDFPEVHIHLHKNIPVGSGLGGGSSNAVSTLKALNHLFELGLNKSQFLNYAQKLGSDCAFFVYNKTAFVEGKGELVKEVDLELTDMEILLVFPGISIPTVDAFSKIQSNNESFSLKNFHQLSGQDWQKKIINDFEKVVFKEHPKIKKIKENLIEKDALYSSLTGSGSAVYAFFPKDEIPDFKWPSNYFVWKGNFMHSGSHLPSI